MSDWLRPFRVLGAVSMAVVATSVAVRALAHRLQVADPGAPPIDALTWFDVNSERNVPTAWSVALLLGCAAVALSLTRRGREGRSGWLLVAAVAGALALDEALSVHERWDDVGAAVVGEALHFAWVVPGVALAAVVGLGVLAALRRQPAEVRRRLAAAGAVYLGGAVVLESVSGLVLRAYGDRELYVAVTAAEEGLEMAGAALLLSALLAVRARRADTEGRHRPPSAVARDVQHL